MSVTISYLNVTKSWNWSDVKNYTYRFQIYELLKIGY